MLDIIHRGVIMKKNYEVQLPENYKEIYSIDAKSKKTGTIFTLLSLIILVVIMGICMLPIFINKVKIETGELYKILIAYVVFFVSMIGYIICHELVHGIAYKALTKQKLTFGLSWSCAFCGVPNIYCYRKTALIALVAPLITFTIILLPLTIVLYFISPIYYLISSFILSLHLSGCIGDIYMTILLLTKYKSPNALIKDTGPKQTIYLND